MQREIKFRAWTKRDKCWISGFSIHQSGLFSDLINARIEMPQHIAIADAHWQDLSKQDEIIVMQYTGMDDKNACDIYEGDLIEYDNALFQVVFISGQMGMKRVLAEKSKPTYRLHKIQGEVIGNIYENPELIKK